EVKAEENARWSTPAYAITSGPVPFNGNTSIAVSLPDRADLELSVFDVKGRLVKTIERGNFTKGLHHFNWNGRDTKGKLLSAGLYVYKVSANNRVLVSKTIIAR
ncbi:MAG: T9SS type A sorting domain-containing protein, partial [Fibrobacteres bacterium]|nr:T9SS type A sorting domain-containing protein [Fibrobacterota bacterium]